MLRCLIVIGISFGCYFLFVYTFMYTYPFIIAIGISILINPMVTVLERKAKLPRSLATVTVIIFIFVILLGTVFLIISEVVQGTLYLADIIPTYFETFVGIIESFVYDKVLPLYQSITSYIHTLQPAQQETIVENIQSFLGYITTTGTAALQSFFLNIPSLILLLPNSLTIFIFIILATFFITKDLERLRHTGKRVIPEKLHNYYHDLAAHLKNAFGGYFKAQLILISISTCITFFGLLILNVEHALTITFLAAIFDILPFIGTGIIFIPWILFTFVTGNYWLTISISILFSLIIIVRQILEPKILSDSIGVNPLFGLFVVFISIQIWGVIGILIAPLLMIFSYVLVQSRTLSRVWEFIKG
ncbi:sporulation integral membrane protein YtvI [Oceanobacillus limi]|nr:sporulation integral membrane protein YtvI [Oceanobacillus limi]